MKSMLELTTNRSSHVIAMSTAASSPFTSIVIALSVALGPSGVTSTIASSFRYTMVAALSRRSAVASASKLPVSSVRLKRRTSDPITLLVTLQHSDVVQEPTASGFFVGGRSAREAVSRRRLGRRRPERSCSSSRQPSTDVDHLVHDQHEPGADAGRPEGALDAGKDRRDVAAQRHIGGGNDEIERRECHLLARADLVKADDLRSDCADCTRDEDL